MQYFARLITLALVFLLPVIIHAKPVERVISLAPHATELAYSAGLGDKLIAASDHSDYPEQAKQLERVANYQGIKLERIITLQPDLIIAWPNGNPSKELEKLKKLGFTIFETKAHSLTEIANSVEALSQYAEDPSIGINNANVFRRELISLKKTYSTNKKVPYFYKLSASPIITIAQKGWPSEVFQFCGGSNIFADSATPYPQVGIEQVVLRRPEVIFTSRHAVMDNGQWAKWHQQIPAVGKEQVWSLNASWINRPTMRSLQAIVQVCDYFEQARNTIE
ncbi:cobalamin-binding protein [Vibrio tapetis]|uniref:Vitamin B12-binding protein n=1 Tax=Vibrio tapetis subsp. tapetis TaxID=1671868 RepID=A0A2N8ZFE4_9VIBR|nr:cobalamin-binding protein [Vibrio tapetis]SON50610.1 Vitamin B12-binding protein [Vibrio tapetis subsp. tapetis]